MQPMPSVWRGRGWPVRTQRSTAVTPCLTGWGLGAGGWGLGAGGADIWTSPADVFASMANYLRRHGWQKEQRALAQVKLTTHPKVQGLDSVKVVEEWTRQYGVVAPDLPSDLQASLVSAWRLKGKGRNNVTLTGVVCSWLPMECEGRRIWWGPTSGRCSSTTTLSRMRLQWRHWRGK